MKDNNLPIWWKTGIIYHIYPQSFKDSNHDGIGDLQGIIQKLDYLQGLGIDAVWLSPIYESPLIDNGYDISDYEGIHPRYGTMDDFMQLLEEAHKRGIKVIMDMVLNHTSDRHPWFVESRSSKDSAKRDWYIWRPANKGKYPNNWRTNFGKKSWRFDPVTNEYYLHSFFWQQPDLNWRNPEVKQEMFRIMSFWLDKGVDGFRFDVINLLFKDKTLRSNSIRNFLLDKKAFNRNQPEIYELLKDLRELLDHYPDRTSIGEIYMLPTGDSKLAASFLGNGSDMLHLAFDFSIIFATWKASAYYKAIRNYYRYLPPDGWPCFFFSNHDVGRSIKNRLFASHKYSKARIQAVLLLTLKGTPFIYYGDEIGMENANIPKHRIQDLYGKLFYPFYKGRDGARTPMQWDDTAYAGFSTNEPWLIVNKNYKTVNVKTEETDKNSVYNTYRKLIALRKQHTVLQSGEIEFLGKGYQNILIYTRCSVCEKIIVLLNFGNSRMNIIVKDSYHAEVLFSTHNKRGTIIEEFIALEPYEALILKSNIQ